MLLFCLISRRVHLREGVKLVRARGKRERLRAHLLTLTASATTLQYSRTMTREIALILIYCSAAYLAFAHPHCHYDEREVDLTRELTFCSMDYAAEGVCCTELEESALEDTYTAAVGGLTTGCADYYKQVRLLPTNHEVQVCDSLTII